MLGQRMAVDVVAEHFLLEGPQLSIGQRRHVGQRGRLRLLRGRLLEGGIEE